MMTVLNCRREENDLRSWLNVGFGVVFMVASVFSHGAALTVAANHGLHASALWMGPPVQG